MQLLVPLKDDAFLIHAARDGDQRLELIRRHRPVVVEALHIPDTHIFQVTDEGGRLHAFDDDRGGKGFGHADHGLQDIDALLLLPDTDAEELGIELDDVHLHAAQHIQGGIAAAEVVHHNP